MSRFTFQRFRSKPETPSPAPDGDSEFSTATDNSNSPARYGLTVLSPPEDDWVEKHGSPTLDIVLVHGLNGHPKRTWTYVDKKTKQEVYWPQDLLPYRVPYARVMVFGYDANVIGNTSSAGLRENGESLLLHLKDEREDDGNDRDIIWIGHSLGGLLIKQALSLGVRDRKFNNIMEKSTAVFFLGTPHRGSDLARWGEIGIRIAKAALVPTTERYVELLRRHSSELMAISTEFRLLAKQMQIYSFYEETKDPRCSAVVVPKWSALLEIENEEAILMMGRNHGSMARFTGLDDRCFALLWRRILKAAPQIKKDREKTDAEWMTLFFPTPNPDFRSGTLEPPQPGTCAWILQDQTLKMWEKKSSGLLWIHGVPGCGKSFIMRYLAAFLKLKSGEPKHAPTKPTVLVFICNRNDESTLEFSGILLSLIRQLFAYHPGVFRPIIKDLVRRQGPNTKPMPISSVAEIWSVFVTAIIGVNTPVFILIDGVDELDDSRIELGLRTSELLKLKQPRQYGLKVLFSGRMDHKLSAALNEFYSIEILPASTSNDIKQYVQDQVQKLASRRKIPDDFCNEIIFRILERPDRTFLWASLILDELSSPKTYASRNSFREKLSTLPVGLFAPYDWILQKIPAYQLHQARTIFTWLALSCRPLNIAELSMAIVINHRHKALVDVVDDESFTITDDVESMGGGLVRIHGEIVELSHQTAREFLLNTSGNSKQYDTFAKYGVSMDDHFVLATACIRALLLKDLETIITADMSTQELYDDDLLLRYPFIRYSLEHWIFHASQVDGLENPEFLTLLDTVFSSTALKIVAWGQRSISVPLARNYTTSLHLAARWGMTRYARRLLRTDSSSVHATDPDLFTPLHEAAFYNRLETAKVLQTAGADVNARSWTNGHAPFHLAAINGHHKFAEWLLTVGGKVDLTDYSNSTSLGKLAEIGDLQMCQWLLDLGADVNSVDGQGNTPTDRARSYGHAAVVELLNRLGGRSREMPNVPENMDTVNSEDEANPIRVAIDFGSATTYVAYVDSNEMVVFIPNEHGEIATPSAVAFHEDQVIVGKDVLDRGSIPPESKVFHLKQLLCLTEETVNDEAPFWKSYGNSSVFISSSHDYEPCIKFGTSGAATPRIMTVRSIVTIFFRHLRQYIVRHFNKATKVEAIITFPAAFSYVYRTRLRMACEDAGITVERFIPEPVAVVAAGELPSVRNESPSLRQERIVLVYDMGAGTFNSSLIVAEDGLFDVKAADSDSSVGGVFFDYTLVNHCAQEIFRRWHINIKDVRYQRDFNRLRFACEHAKRVLSIQTSAHINVHLLGREFTLTVTRESFEPMWKPIIQKTIASIDKIFEGRKISKNQVDTIYLTGGSTRIPLIRKTISDMFPTSNVHTALNPDEAVVVGAASYQNVVYGLHPTAMLLVDAMTVPITLQCANGFDYVIPSNASIPIKKFTTITTSYHNQDRVRLNFFEQTQPPGYIGGMWLTGLRPAPKETLVIEVTVEIDWTRKISFTAVEKPSGLPVKIVASSIIRGKLPEEWEQYLPAMVPERPDDNYSAGETEPECDNHSDNELHGPKGTFGMERVRRPY